MLARAASENSAGAQFVPIVHLSRSQTSTLQGLRSLLSLRLNSAGSVLLYYTRVEGPLWVDNGGKSATIFSWSDPDNTDIQIYRYTNITHTCKLTQTYVYTHLNTTDTHTVGIWLDIKIYESKLNPRRIVAFSHPGNPNAMWTRLKNIQWADRLEYCLNCF